MDIQKNIAATLRAAMLEKQKTQAEFSEELGIAHSSLQEYLKDGANPCADTIGLLADKLGITPEELISGPHSVERLKELHTQSKSIHPLLSSAAEECFRMIHELFVLSDKLYAMEAGEADDE